MAFGSVQHSNRANLVGIKLMSDNPKAADAAEKESDDVQEVQTKPLWWRRFLTKRWLPILCVVTLLLHCGLLASWRSAIQGPEEKLSEIELGEFRFINTEKNARVEQAEFDIHVSLLLGTERLGSQRLAEKKFLVQQGIEELLRQTHAADFDDPTLAELKRQIQEKINESVEMRTVETVIITDLEKSSRDSAIRTMPASAGISAPRLQDPEASRQRTQNAKTLNRTVSVGE